MFTFYWKALNIVLQTSEQLCVIFGSGDFKIHVILTYEPQ